ncbi:MAG: orotate phosphoribosyltransferase [Magnetococcus sp. MYC-9]
MTKDTVSNPQDPQGESDSSVTRQAFLRFSLEAQVLRFGRFQTKAGRITPYFFNAGQFNSGALLAQLGAFYADTLLQARLPFDMLFGPAYKGIPLVTATATALAQRHQRDVPIAYNRKESKDHGEGGLLIGAPLQGRVVIIDDVISAGTSVYESAGWIRDAGAQLACILIALDRQERGSHSPESAVQEVSKRLAVPVIAIARLEDLIHLLAQSPEYGPYLPAIHAYRQTYGG